MILVKSIAQATSVNSKNGIVDRYYWRRYSLTITESFVGSKVDYMKAHDYNSTGRVREIAVQFVRERQIYRGALSVGLFNVRPLPINLL